MSRAAERWPAVKSIFHAALDLPAAARPAYLEQVCGADEDLRAEVAALLAEDGRGAAGAFTLPQAARRALLADAPEGDEVPRIGAYRLVREIGRGGSGVVYLAVRDDREYRQRVALKVIHRDSEDVRRRALQERQILATLEHPHIARLLGGGSTADGRPYLVMELVEGVPIDRYCAAHRLSLEQRLELVRVVCEAVQHAHQHLVVHRDLKPSNVLVSEGGAPKLLDFGIAKLLGPARDSALLRTTAPDQRLLTPVYASPEQLRGEAVTTACDVYALGVLLYELTTGELPHAAEHPAELVRRICDADPPLPSLRPADRGRRRRLRGDVDGIVMKALSRVPARRYASAEQLARDLGRHLAHQPVLARRQTFLYRGFKLMRRHAWATAAVVLLAVFAAAMTVQSVRATRALARADAEQARASGVASFLLELFAAAAPNAAQGRTVTARDMLDLGARRVTSGVDHAPVMQATLMETMAEAYEGLGEWQAAAALLEDAVALRERVQGAEHPDLASSLEQLARVVSATGESPAALALQHRALAIRRARFGAEHPAVAAALHGLGEVHYAAGDRAAAERFFRQALAMRRALLGDDHPETAENLHELASLLRDRGDLAGAEPLMRRALELKRRHLGERHTEVALLENDLALLLLERGEAAAALPLLERSIETFRLLLGPDHMWTSTAQKNLAKVYRAAGDLEAAEALLRQVLDGRRRVLPAESPHIAWAAQELGRLLVERGDAAVAEELLRGSVDILRRALPAGDWPIAGAEAALAASLAAQGRYAEAEELLLAAHRVYREQLGPDHHRTRRLGERLDELYAAWGRLPPENRADR